MKLKSGQIPPNFVASDIQGKSISLEDYRGQWLLLSFLRFAACPRCGLRLYSLSLRYPRLQAAGLQVVAFVESSSERVREQPYAATVPFPVIADPTLEYYHLYDLKTSRFGLFWGGLTRKRDIAQSLSLGFGQGVADGNDRRMPADFLISPDQKISFAHYGRDSGDSLRLEKIEQLMAERSSQPVAR